MHFQLSTVIFIRINYDLNKNRLNHMFVMNSHTDDYNLSAIFMLNNNKPFYF